MSLDHKYPSVADLEKAAERRLPGFARDYLYGGIGADLNLQRNRRALDEVMFMPRYLSAAPLPDLRCTLFGREYDAPFGVAPVGLSGLIWPRAEYLLAAAAKKHNIPYTLSTVATVSLEDVKPAVGDCGWFQYYPVNNPNIEQDMLERSREAGYDTILLTVDVPVHTRRAHDMRNGLSVPPRVTLKNIAQITTHPSWAFGMLAAGIPQFQTIKRYYENPSLAASLKFLGETMKDQITEQRFNEIRRRWGGNLVVKGVLDATEAKRYFELGADAVLVSNHGGRQADAAPATASVLPQIRDAVGPDAVLLVDSGVRSGLDVARMLALGANFVLMGRPFLFSVAAAGGRGAEHVMQLLKDEMCADLGQLGCPSIGELANFLYRSD